jgi:hypothetical protein
MTAPSADNWHREILKEREEQAKLNPAQFSDWNEAKKRIQDRTAQQGGCRSPSGI